jgi:hypothetical protein
MLGPVVACAGIVSLALGAGAFALPARRGTARLSLEELTLGLLLGLALQVLLLQGMFDALGRRAFLAALAIGAAGWLFGVVWLVIRRVPVGIEGDRVSWIGLAAVGVVVVAPVVLFDAPRGHDPVFHSILTRKLLQEGRLVRDWKPYERVPVNYPQGSHLLLALTCQTAGLEPHTAFQANLAWSGLLETLALWTLAGAFATAPEYRLAAVVLHTAAARFGSPLHVQLWGGFPTLLGSCLTWGLAALFLSESRRPVLVGLAGGLGLTALLIVHHLSALIAAYLGSLWWGISLTGRSETERARRRAGAIALVVALVLSAPIVAWYAGRISGLAQTHTLRYGDESSYFGLAFAESLGWTLIPWAVVGFGAVVFNRDSLRNRPYLFAWTLGLSLAYLALDVGYRAYSEGTLGRSLSAFTPSRWLTALTLPLSLIGAAPFARGMTRRARVFARIALAATAVFGLVGTLRDVWTTPTTGTRDLPLYRWVRDSTPPDAFLLTDASARVAGNPWMPYHVERESFLSPLPASEPRDAESVREKRELFDRSRRAGDQSELLEWLARTGRTGYLLVGPGRLTGELPPSLRVVGSFRGYALVKLQPPSRAAPSP